jgi:Tol biopolymer transport system component
MMTFSLLEKTTALLEKATVGGLSKTAVSVPILVIAALVGGCAPLSSEEFPAPACEVKEITRAPDGLVIWAPSGEQYIINKKDAAGTYQFYVGTKSDMNPVCVTCTERPNSPAVNRHKLQPRWHPSGNWIALAGEREDYQTPLLATPALIEGWVQSGLWVNIYMTRPDGSEWYRLSDFGPGRADGFTGVAFSPDGTKAVWAQIVSGNIFEAMFGRWELILADFQEDVNGVPSFTNLRDITPEGAKWVEPGNFAPDGKSLLITADIGLSDAQGMDQFILDITTGEVRNLTKSPDVWDEHGVFSNDGKKIFFMSSYPYRANPLSHTILFLQTEFMQMNSDGSGLQQLTHFNSLGYPESNPWWRKSVAANGDWHPDGWSISALNLFFPTYETWTIRFNESCGGDARAQPQTVPAFHRNEKNQ